MNGPNDSKASLTFAPICLKCGAHLSYSISRGFCMHVGLDDSCPDYLKQFKLPVVMVEEVSQ